MERYTTDTGQHIRVHNKGQCEGKHCPIHNPSLRAQQIGKTHWRTDRAIMERICVHGIGHPDPDSEYQDDIHGCDGCCSPPYGVPGFPYNNATKRVEEDKQVEIDSDDRLSAVLMAKFHLKMLELAVYNDRDHAQQRLALNRVKEALKPLEVEVIKNGD
jgi:hypothetical protein